MLFPNFQTQEFDQDVVENIMDGVTTTVLNGEIESSNTENNEDQSQFLKLVKDITSKGFVRSDYNKNLVDLSDIRINLKGKK